MQTEKHDQDELNQEDKVVSIFDRNKTSQKSKSTAEQNSSEPDYDFETTMRRNLENKTKLQKERSKSNRGVIRSYRLKN